MTALGMALRFTFVNDILSGVEEMLDKNVSITKLF